MSSPVFAGLILCPRMKGTLQIAKWIMVANSRGRMRVGEVKVKLGYEMETVDV